MTRSLCIVSGEPLRSGAIAALHAAVDENEEITIVVDRRKGGPGIATSRPVDRRGRPSVDAKVKKDGFAIVPASTDDARETDPPWIEQRASRNILEFKRRRQGRIGPLLGLTAVVGVVALVVVVLGHVTGLRTPGARVSAPQNAVQAPVVETIPPPPRDRVSPPRDSSPRKRSEPASPRAEPARKPLGAVPAPPLAEPTGEALPAPQAPLAASTPPARQPTSSPPEVGSPRVSAEPARPPEASTPPRAHAVATPADSAPPTNSAPSRPIGVNTFIKEQISRDVSAAGAEAKRQGDELKVQAIRVWNNARRVFGDSSR
jgi:hypothetical protein